MNRKAFTLVELVVVIAIFLVMLMALTPFVHIAKARKNKIDCAANLMKISLGLHSYAAEHDGAFPVKLGDLYPNYLSDEKAFDCPSAKVVGTKEKPDYVYTAGLTELAGPKEIIAQDTDGNHKRHGKNIVRVNGSIEWIGTSR